ncbi:MAG: hypothetical protein RLN82_07500 [Pseudomonadales bacterium]
MISSARQSLRERLEKWLEQRQPETAREVFSQHNLYIFPSGQFVGFLLVTMMMWLAGTNYENNLVLALTFFMLAIFVSTIFRTHANLSGLEVAVTACDRAFAEERLTVHLNVENPSGDDRLGIVLRWADAYPVSIDVPAKSTVQTEIRLQTQQRGWLNPGRLRVETTYPLGILRAWSWPRLQLNALVYPKPVAAEPTSGERSEGGEGQSHKRGIDDFGGLTEWQPGVSLQRIAWKQYSAGRGLLEKTFEAQTLNPEWLDWENYAGLGTEQRLSALCAKILEMEELGQHYGLRLPGQVFLPAQGEVHMHRLLSALAIYGLEELDA